MALVVLSVVEQRLDAVRAVLAGAGVTVVAAQAGVHRSTVHRWVERYLAGQVAGLTDRSHQQSDHTHLAADRKRESCVKRPRRPWSAAGAVYLAVLRTVPLP